MRMAEIEYDLFTYGTNDQPNERDTENGRKLDGGKPPIYKGVLCQFPKAMRAVADVSAFGAAKYDWDNWREVPDRFERYSDALVRHLASEGEGEVTDRDSGRLHAAHVAWNSLLRLETIIEELEREAAVPSF